MLDKKANIDITNLTLYVAHFTIIRTLQNYICIKTSCFTFGWECSKIYIHFWMKYMETHPYLDPEQQKSAKSP